MRHIALALMLAAGLLAAAPGAAQVGRRQADLNSGSYRRDESVAARPRPAAVRLAVLDLAFYGKRATSLEPGDSLLAAAATKTVRGYLARDSAIALVDSAAVAAAARSPEALDAATGRPCNVVVACARAAGRKLGVPWVVMGKVSKTSNLIWLFSGELVDVATGQLVIDDQYELKGVATDLVPKGARAFARRVAKRVAAAPAAEAAAPARPAR